MNLLLDSHVVLWAFGDPKRLGPRTTELITDSDTSVAVSAATIWEIEIKRTLGKLTAPDGTAEMCRERGFEELPITFEHAIAAAHLPTHHHDPFDRVLIAQSLVDGWWLVTADRRFADYGVPIVNARS